MIGASLPAAGAAPASATPAGHDAAAPDESRSGFADLLAPKNEPAPPTPESKDASSGRSESRPAESRQAESKQARSDHTESEDEDTDARPEASLAERLLALIGASATPAQAAATPGKGPPASLAPARPQPAPGTGLHGVLAAALPGGTAAPGGAMAGLPLDPALAAQAGTQAGALATGQAPAAAAGTATPAAVFAAVPSTAAVQSPPPAPTVAATGAMLADLAQAMAPGTREAGRDAGIGRESLEIGGIGDRGPLLASGPAATTRPVTAPAAAGMLAMPANPDAGFDDAFGARIGWMAEQGIGRAELRINPEHLGAVEVRLQMDGTRVSAEFQSPNAEVRQALEQSVGRLREMLGQHGLQLAHADVGQGRGDGQPSRSSAQGGTGMDDDGFVDMPAAATPLRSRGLLDEYA